MRRDLREEQCGLEGWAWFGLRGDLVGDVPGGGEQEGFGVGVFLHVGDVFAQEFGLVVQVFEGCEPGGHLALVGDLAGAQGEDRVGALADGHEWVAGDGLASARPPLAPGVRADYPGGEDLAECADGYPVVVCGEDLADERGRVVLGEPAEGFGVSLAQDSEVVGLETFEDRLDGLEGHRVARLALEVDGGGGGQGVERLDLAEAPARGVVEVVADLVGEQAFEFGHCGGEVVVVDDPRAVEAGGEVAEAGVELAVALDEVGPDVFVAPGGGCDGSQEWERLGVAPGADEFGREGHDHVQRAGPLAASHKLFDQPGEAFGRDALGLDQLQPGVF